MHLIVCSWRKGKGREEKILEFFFTFGSWVGGGGRMYVWAYWTGNFERANE